MVDAANAKNWAQEHLRGLFCSPLTVFNDDYSLDAEGLAYNVDHMAALGADGLGYGHGEPWSLSHAERKETVDHFIKAVNGRMISYVHAFDHSAPDTVDFTNHAAEAGADLVMLEPPYEHAKSEAHIYAYYKFVAERTDIGIILLNTPHSGRIMSAGLLDRLADIPAVCAIKDGINDFSAARLHARAVSDRIVFSMPREEEILPLMMYAGQHVQLGTSAVFLLQTPDWQPVRQYYELAMQGRFEEAFRVWSALGPLRNFWSEMHTSLWGADPEHPIAKAKAWSEVMGMRGGPMRPPLESMESRAKERFQAAIREILDEVRANPVFADATLAPFVG
jgi:4-hydroxy-tetrahydrodipicolinate synthase